MKGRIVVLKEYGKPFEIEEHEVPDPEPGAIVLKMVEACICGSDLHTWRGDQVNITLPPTGRVMGHEGFGIVHSLGKGVATDSMGVRIGEGDRVVHAIVFPCNRCYICLRGEQNHCPNRGRYPPSVDYPYFTGAYGDYFYVPPGHAVFRVPDELPDEVLAPVNDTLSSVAQGLISAGCRFGDSVVIQGAGGLGLAATAFVKDMGAVCVIVLDRLQNRLQLAREFGADHIIDIDEGETQDSRRQRIWELTGGRGADLVVETAGLVELLPQGIAMLRNGGTLLELGNIAPGKTVEFDPSTVLMGKRIVGSLVYPPSVLPMVLSYLVRNLNRYPFHKIISHRFKLEDVNEAFSKAEWRGRKTETIRAALVP